MIEPRALIALAATLSLSTLPAAAAPEAAASPAPSAPEAAAPPAPSAPDAPAPLAPPAAPAAPPDSPVRPDVLYYPEEADGESTLTLGYGVGGWFTDRGPLADFATFAPQLGYDHRIGPARLGWRAQLYLDPTGDAPLAFLYVDFVSIEYVFAEGAVRPFARGALGFGLDLVDDDVLIEGVDRELGDDLYFSEQNGPTGGPGLTLGAGLDLIVAAPLFVRLEVFARGYGGVGEAAAMWGGALALGMLL